MRRIVCMLLILMLLIPLLPTALADSADAEPIPYSLNVLSSAHEESFIVDGYYAEGNFFVSPVDIVKILDGLEPYIGPHSTDFTIEGGMRAFHIDHKREILQETSALQSRWEFDTNVPVFYVNGAYYVALTDFLRYCDMFYQLSPDGDINLIVYDRYTLNDVILDLEALDSIAWFDWSYLGESEAYLFHRLNMAYDISIIEKGKTLLQLIAGEQWYQEQIIEEVLLDILETGSAETLPKAMKLKDSLSPYISDLSLLMDDQEDNSIKAIGDAYKESFKYASLFNDMLYAVARFERIDELERTLLQKTLLDNANLCPSLQEDNKPILTVADRLSFKLSGQKAAVLMESAEYLLDYFTTEAAGELSVMDTFKEPAKDAIEKALAMEIPDPSKLLKNTLKDFHEEEQKIITLAYKHMKKELGTAVNKVVGVKERIENFKEDNQRLYKAYVASIVCHLANEQMAHHYNTLMQSRPDSDYRLIADDLLHALILQLKASIATRQYLVDCGEDFIEPATLVSLTGHIKKIEQLLADVEHCEVVVPCYNKVPHQEDFSWMPLYYESLEGYWVVDPAHATPATEGLRIGVQLPDTISISLTDNTNAARTFKLVGKYLVMDRAVEDYFFFLDTFYHSDIRLMSTRGNSVLRWTKEELPTDGAHVDVESTSCAIMKDVFDFDGDGVKESIFLDQYADTSYFWAQVIPTDAAADIYDGNDAWTYQSSHPFILVMKKYYRDGYYSDHDNPKWPAADVINWGYLKLQSLDFLRAPDGNLYAAEAATVYGSNYITFYQQKDGKMELVRLDAEAIDYAIPYEEAPQLNPSIAYFACEYVADLKQWCFVIGQKPMEGDENGEFPIVARTCLTMNSGTPVIVARYIYDQRVE